MEHQTLTRKQSPEPNLLFAPPARVDTPNYELTAVVSRYDNPALIMSGSVMTHQWPLHLALENLSTQPR